MSNILIIKHGSLGDIAQACGAIQDISENHKGDEIYLLTTKPYFDLFKKNPHISDVILDKRLSRLNLIYLYSLMKNIKKYNFSKIAAIESRGFVFASAVSFVLKKPFIMLRKKNKLPADVHSVDFELEYGTATIEVHKDSINEKDEVLIIDDLIATGGTAEAAAKLVEISKGKVSAFVFVINLFDLGGSDNLVKSNYKVENLIEFPGH